MVTVPIALTAVMTCLKLVLEELTKELSRSNQMLEKLDELQSFLEEERNSRQSLERENTKLEKQFKSACKHRFDSLSISYWVAKCMVLVGDRLGRKAPINSLKLDEITKSLTFSNEKAIRELGWKPTNVLENFNIE